MHHVHTGVVMLVPQAGHAADVPLGPEDSIDEGWLVRSFACTTEVEFDELDHDTIEAYVKSGEFRRRTCLRLAGMMGWFASMEALAWQWMQGRRRARFCLYTCRCAQMRACLRLVCVHVCPCCELCYARAIAHVWSALHVHDPCSLPIPYSPTHLPQVSPLARQAPTASKAWPGLLCGASTAASTTLWDSQSTSSASSCCN